MRIPELSENLSIISQLGNNPGTDDGLSADELKAKFDEAVLIIQRYINQTLLPKVNASVSPEDGLTMRADIAMGNHRVKDVAAPEEDGDAVNLGYVKKVGNPHNLLDNSDFRNPVNQRGKESYTTGYTIDRWMLPVTSGDCNITENGLELTNGSAEYDVQVWQLLDIQHTGKIFTLAVCDSNGAIYVVSGNGETANKVESEWGRCGFGTYNGYLRVFIRVLYGKTKTFRWAALYEGEYTAETLPEYQPKGYGAELAECQRYYWPMAGLYQAYGHGNEYGSFAADIVLPVEMRVNPTVSYTLRSFFINGEDKMSTLNRVDVECSTKRLRFSPVTLIASDKNKIMRMAVSNINLSADL